LPYPGRQIDHTPIRPLASSNAALAWQDPVTLKILLTVPCALFRKKSRMPADLWLEAVR
jgi:hypothetical protein